MICFFVFGEIIRW